MERFPADSFEIMLFLWDHHGATPWQNAPWYAANAGRVHLVADPGEVKYSFGAKYLTKDAVCPNGCCFEYVFLWDGDVELPPSFDAERLVAILRAERLDMAQPALGEGLPQGTCALVAPRGRRAAASFSCCVAGASWVVECVASFVPSPRVRLHICARVRTCARIHADQLQLVSAPARADMAPILADRGGLPDLRDAHMAARPRTVARLPIPIVVVRLRARTHTRSDVPALML